MTARSLLPSDLARLRACAPIVAAKGAASPYAADCAVRAYRGRHVGELCRDLGWACDAGAVVVIAAGMGTLTLTWTGNRFAPVIAEAGHPDHGPLGPSPALTPRRLSAPADLAARRGAICRACSHHAEGRCTVAGCACAGLGQPEHLHSRCPLGNW